METGNECRVWRPTTRARIEIYNSRLREDSLTFLHADFLKYQKCLMLFSLELYNVAEEATLLVIAVGVRPAVHAIFNTPHYSNIECC